MISFMLDGDATAAAAAVVDGLTMFAIAPSLGGAESIVTQPVTTSYHGLDPAERAARGIADSMIRLSVGLEDPGNVIKGPGPGPRPGHLSTPQRPPGPSARPTAARARRPLTRPGGTR
jgi:hypothetical protein